MADIDVLKNIEKTYGITLKQNSLEKVEDILENHIYALDDKNQIVGLILGNSKISDLNPIKELKNLTTLYLSSNQISDLNPIKELEHLTLLYLSSNQISDLNPIKELKHLTSLYLSSNQISDLNPIKELKHLTSLYLSSNQISDLNPIKELKHLTTIDLRQNAIHHLPEWIIDFSMEIYYAEYLFSGITLFNNTLEQPPIEVINQGKYAIKNYFEELGKQGTVQLYEAKLLVVGQGNSGKSWLMYHLVNGNKPDKSASTEGIQIIKWTVDDVVHNLDGTTSPFEINFWDFGGQEIYHSTHQFFLTKRSLYLFVWEARTDDDIIGFDYWLNVIRLLSDNASVIVVMNKCDERTKEIDGKSITEKFPNVKRFFSVSASRGDGIADLKKEIIREITQLPLVGNTLPKVWTDIRKELEQLDKNYISYKEYCALCKKHGQEQEQAEYLSKYYHDLGVFLYFGDNTILRDRVFLKPDWATKAAYKILDQDEVKANKGKFRYKELKKYWDDYEEQEYKYLLELMQKFELCFKLAEKQTYIVPELLPASEPETSWDDTDNLRFEYHYEFMPAGILTRLMVHLNYLLKDEIYWKNGLVLTREHCDALLKAEPFNRKIIVRLRGVNRGDLLSVIRTDIDYIHSTLNNPDVKEMVHCNCEVCSKSSKPKLFLYNELRQYQSIGERTIKCNNNGLRDVEVLSLLRDVPITKKEEEESKGKQQNGDNFHINAKTVTIMNRSDHSTIDQSEFEVNTPEVEEPKKKKWYETVWAIIGGIAVIIGLIAAIFQILHW